MTSSFADLDRVCSALGLERKKCKKGHMWKGFLNDRFVRITIHDKSGGRDIPTGTFCKYVKDLGFGSIDEYFEYLKSL